MKDVDVWICSQELGFVLKSEQREALELLLRGKDVFCILPTGFDKSLTYQMFVELFMPRVLQVPCNGQPSLLSRLAKKERSVGNTRLLPHAKMLLVPMNQFLCRVDYASEETFWLSKCEFCPLNKYISYWEVVTSILISSGHDLPSDARAFWLGPFRNVKLFIATD